MSERLRKPLYQAPKPATAAQPYDDSPALRLEAMYRRVWETSMHNMPFVNNALTVAAVGFLRHEGDWIGAVITPWFLNLYVLPGGGSLWTDLASGDRVKIPFPVGELEFIADYDPDGDVPAYQYCPLFQPVSQFVTQEAALAAAESAMAALFTAPIADDYAAPAAETPPGSSAPQSGSDSVPSRRAFFRRVAGQG